MEQKVILRDEKLVKMSGFLTAVTTLGSALNYDNLFRISRISMDETTNIKNIHSKVNRTEQIIRSIILR